MVERQHSHTGDSTSATESLFRRVIVPVANEDDAEATATALVPYLASGGTVIAVYVVEKAGGAPDKAAVEQRERFAGELFDRVVEVLAPHDVDLRTELLYGTDVAGAIVDAAHEEGASAIVFTPRGGSRWRKLLSGDVTVKLVNRSDVPVLVLPNRPEVDDA